MKKIYFLLALAICSVASAQIVNIPDTNLKNALLNNNQVIDTNGDGEIQESEAQAYNYEFGLNLYNKEIVDITGLEFFTNIDQISLGSNDITAIDFSQFPHITSFFLAQNELSTVDLTLNPSLIKLNLSNNNLTTIDISQNVLLEVLGIGGNEISQLDIEANTNLKRLSLQGLPLTNLNLFNHDLIQLSISSTDLERIDISNQTNLELLDFGYSSVVEIDVSDHTSLRFLGIEHSELQALDISQNINLNHISFGGTPLNQIDLSNNINLDAITLWGDYTGSLDLSQNTALRRIFMAYSNFSGPLNLMENTTLNKVSIQNTNIEEIDFSNNTELCLVGFKNNELLKYVNLQNGNNTLLIPDNPCQFSDQGSTSSAVPFRIIGSPEIEFVCVDEVDYAIENFQIPDTATFIDNCDGDLDAVNYIVGNISYDFNSDGCDNADFPIPDVIFNVTDGNSNFSSLSNQQGNYNVNVLRGTYNSQIIGLPDYFTVGVNNQDIVFDNVDETQIVDYCVIANEQVNDVNVSIFPLTESRPGFETTYKIIISNQGTQTANGDTTLNFDAALLNFLNASETPSQTDVNTITWSYSNLGPFETKMITANFLIEQPPTVNGDDILEISANVTPLDGDITPSDNTFILSDVVVNSFDPNDKKVLQGSEVNITKKDEYLTYMIRFQNIGSASAINVRLEDALDSQLDWTTLKLVDMSHHGKLSILDDKDMTVQFDNIQLPSSEQDEKGSHGYIVYKIKPKKDIIELGSIVRNTAAIYFDFNEPIITNTVSTTYVTPQEEEETSATEEEEEALLVNTQVFPNPTENILNVRSVVPISHLTIYDMTGRKVAEQSYAATSAKIETANLQNGTYLLKITTFSADRTIQIIKN